MNARTFIVSIPPIRKVCLALAYRLGVEISRLNRIPRRRTVKKWIQNAKVDLLLFAVKILAKKDGAR